jgi:hypothetical protein
MALGALAIGAGIGAAAAWLHRPAERTRIVTTTTVDVVNGSRAVGRRPAPLPTLLRGADPHRIPLARAVPVDANVDTADYVMRRPRQLVVTWDRSAATWQRLGVAIWQLDRGDTARWHRVYVHEAPMDVAGVDRYEVTLGDASGDGRPEVLIFFDTDGSAGNGSYHLFANAGYRLRQVFTKELSQDEGTISFAHHALVVRDGVDFRGPGIHCCYRKVRETWLRWDGRRMVTVRQVVRGNRRGWPPG